MDEEDEDGEDEDDEDEDEVEMRSDEAAHLALSTTTSDAMKALPHL